MSAVHTHGIGNDLSLSRDWVMHMLNDKGNGTDTAPPDQSSAPLWLMLTSFHARTVKLEGAPLLAELVLILKRLWD